MPLHLLQAAAQAVAVAPPSGALSTGEWVGIVTLGLTMMGACFQFGRVLANGSHLRQTVETQLVAMDAKLDKITEQGEAAQRDRVSDATRLANAERDAAEAKDVAHKAHNAAQAAQSLADRHESRLESLERDRDRSEMERRTGPPDRRD